MAVDPTNRTLGASGALRQLIANRWNFKSKLKHTSLANFVIPLQLFLSGFIIQPKPFTKACNSEK
jgi:hypothetical protein